MKIALYQGAGKPTKIDENLAIIQDQALAAAEQGADLIIFPELILSGYNIGQTVQELAEPADGPAGQRASQIAREANLAILYGYPEKLDTEVYNSALLIDRNGNTQANYRKTHLFGSYEKSCFKPGDALIIAELEGLNIGILICYDVEFPEAVRALIYAGADLIAVPTALMEDYCRVAEHVVPARAYESEIYVAYVTAAVQRVIRLIAAAAVLLVRMGEIFYAPVYPRNCLSPILIKMPSQRKEKRIRSSKIFGRTRIMRRSKKWVMVDWLIKLPGLIS